MPITWWSQLFWLLALALTSLLVTWIFTDLLHLTQATYIGVLAAVTGIFLYAYLSWSNAGWVEFLSHQWLWGLIGAIVVGPLLVAMLARGRRAPVPMFAAAERPQGLRLVGALLWEGLVYGVAEGLLLSVLPVLVTWQALSSLHWTESWYGVVLSGIIALAASVVVIVVHHLGYREFRGHKLPFAIADCAPLSLASLLTMNPLAAVLGHSILHMGAVLGGTELPPHREKSEHAMGSMMSAHRRRVRVREDRLRQSISSLDATSTEYVLNLFRKEVRTMMEEITLRDYERAETEIRAKERRMSFYVHAAIYVLVNILLLVVNLVFVPGFLWFFFPLIGWGIGLTMHFLFGVLWIRSETEGWQARVEHRAREIHAQPA